MAGNFYWTNVDSQADEDSSDEGTELINMENTSWKLYNVDIRFKQGSLNLVIGKVGAGKSTLIHSLLGETNCEGEVKLHGNSVALCAQQPWIYNATLRENILFHSDYDEDRYNRVIYACALEEDLRILACGDLTEIGEHGINLSGGQQARVSLARAVYSNSDIYLLDDIFSAVDAHVAQHTFSKCILGELQGKTTILVTHKLEYMDHADWIVHIGAYNELYSQVLIQGTPEELKRSNFAFTSERDSLEQYKQENTERSEGTKETEPCSSNDLDTARLTIEEEHETGVVKLSVFFGYLKALGYITVCIAGKYW